MNSNYRINEFDVRSLMGGAPKKKDIVVYGRVSSAGQKDDLASQVRAMEEYCRGAGVPVDVWMQEVGDMRKYKKQIQEDFVEYKIAVVQEELQ